eukprot:1916422-Rhodomonas_salina.1
MSGLVSSGRRSQCFRERLRHSSSCAEGRFLMSSASGFGHRKACDRHHVPETSTRTANQSVNLRCAGKMVTCVVLAVLECRLGSQSRCRRSGVTQSSNAAIKRSFCMPGSLHVR